MIHAGFALGMLVLIGSVASAAPVSIVLVNETDRTGVVGTGGAHIQNEIVVVRVNDVDVYGLSGHVSLLSGPLVEVHATFDPVSGTPVGTLYRYASAWLTVDFEWTSTAGVQRHGRFSAPVVGTGSRFPYSNAGGWSSPALAIGVDEYVGAFAPRTEDWIVLGRGVFSNRLARLLGVQQGASGNIDQILETIEGHPLDTARTAFVYLNQVELYAVTVPEPGLAALVGLAVLAATRRRSSSAATPSV